MQHKIEGPALSCLHRQSRLEQAAARSRLGRLEQVRHQAPGRLGIRHQAVTELRSGWPPVILWAALFDLCPFLTFALFDLKTQASILLTP